MIASGRSPVPDHVVVVGASLAGLRAVEEARALGHRGPITLIGAERHLPYDRPPLSKEYLDVGPTSTTHVLPSAERLAGDLDVDLHLGAPATSLDLTDRTVTVGGERVPYDALLITTGVTPRTLPAARRLEGVHTLRTIEDATAIHDALERKARTVIVGAGFIGAEIASAAVRRGVTPTVVEAAPVPLVRAVGETAGAALARLHARHGVRLRCDVGVKELIGDRHVQGVRLGDDSVLEADLVVVGIGASPCTGWLEGSGLTLDNGVACDETLRAADRVYAAGDVARWMNPLFDRPMRLEHWTNAGEQAAHAMANLLAPASATAYAHVPYFWSDWYGRRIQFAGIPAGEPTVVSGSWDEDAFVALFRAGDRLAGVLTLDRRGDIMKYRALIGRRATWDSALDLAATRNMPTSPAAAGVASPS
jgi:NADPH-dependent 2,4-dienoyl-CoA reductase/sulfur reductase-like enzyme